MKASPRPFRNLWQKAGVFALLARCRLVNGFCPLSSASCRRLSDQHKPSLPKATVADGSTVDATINENEFNTVIPDATHPLPLHTFAGKVEHCLQNKFVDSNVDRILTSWRLLEQGYEHREFFDNLDDQTVTATSSNRHQHCHSYVPGLTVKEFWDTDQFDWCSKLQSKYAAIRKEFRQVTADMDALTRQGNNIWAGALTDDASSYGKGWKTLVLMDRGVWDPVNVNLFPVTAQAVRDSGVAAVEVFFASMQPHTEIKPHTDFTNFVLTSHLALDIPYSGQNKCRLTIGDETREWINGELMVFDTSLLHEAINDSDKTRYILMIRLWHPDLSQAEQEALQFTYDSLELADLVSDNPEERYRAELTANAMHAFPEILKGKTKVQGFGGGGSVGKKKKKRGKR